MCTAQGSQWFQVCILPNPPSPAHPSLSAGGTNFDEHQLITLCSHSRQALKKYVLANNKLDGISDGVFTTQFNKALQKGSDSGVFARPKGTLSPTIAPTHHASHDFANCTTRCVASICTSSSFNLHHTATVTEPQADLVAANRHLRHSKACRPNQGCSSRSASC